MAADLGFMFPGRDEKLQQSQIPLSNTIGEVISSLSAQLAEAGLTDPEKPKQICLIYSGRVLKPEDVLSTVLNTNLQPPYTMQVLLKPEKNDEEPNRDEVGDNQCCCSIS